MKYHSFYWWFIAIKEQMKDFVRNTLCRKLFHIDFGYTKPDLLAMYVMDNQDMLYNTLISKYPELRNIRKYILNGTACTVTEFLSAGIFYYFYKRISVFWTNEGTIDDILFLIKNGVPCNLNIINVLGVHHAVTIVGYNEENNTLIYNDPLGDPWTKYKIVFGFNITITIDKLIKETSNLIKINFQIDNDKQKLIDQIKNLFFKRKLYLLEPIDWDKGIIFENNSFALVKYSKDGKIDIDLGNDARMHFIQIYGEYSKIKKTSWDDDKHINIMEEIAKSGTIRKII
ncbi:hypothetical protein AGMMS49546_33190 [Spirochaetia bacterium]|nr:hypothetical protein AGMMS49546_33190 [Spirochaetia bacterium]